MLFPLSLCPGEIILISFFGYHLLREIFARSPKFFFPMFSKCPQTRKFHPNLCESKMAFTVSLPTSQPLGGTGRQIRSSMTALVTEHIRGQAGHIRYCLRYPRKWEDLMREPQILGGLPAELWGPSPFSLFFFLLLDREMSEYHLLPHNALTHHRPQ